MMKGGSQKKPRFAGLDERDFVSNEGDVPITYFAGVRKLPGSAIMTPVIARIKNTPGGGKGK